MPSSALRILVVGSHLASTNAVLRRLLFRGWASYAVDTLSQAQSVLRTIQFDIVLASEHLPDGRGYDLTASVAQSSGTLLVCVALSENCLWLPVLEEGTRVLGDRAINSNGLEHDMERLLASSSHKRSSDSQRGDGRPGSKREIPPRRKQIAENNSPVQLALPASGTAALISVRPAARSTAAK